MSIQDLIASKGDALTPTERRIARVIVADDTRLAFGTVAELAELAETSPPSIVRFASKLGFAGYSELQTWMRERVARRLSTPGERIRQSGGRGSLQTEIESAVAHVFDALDDERLNTLAAPLARAARVWILSGETSMAGAHALASGLSMLRADVQLVFEHSAGRDLSGASPGDAAVVLDFARYRRVPLAAARSLVEDGVELVAITDGPLSPLAALTPHWCALRIPAVGPFDSAVPAVMAAELIVTRVASLLGDSARDRIDRLEERWRAVGVFETHSPREDRPG